MKKYFIKIFTGKNYTHQYSKSEWSKAKEKFTQKGIPFVAWWDYEWR